MYRGQTQFHCPAWLRAMLSFAAALVPVLTVIEYRANNVNWVVIGLSLLSIGMMIAVFAVFTDRFELGESELRMRHNFMSNAISRSDIEKVTWAKGCGVILQMKNGQTIKLPDIGLNSQSFCNSLRAWIKAA